MARVVREFFQKTPGEGTQDTYMIGSKEDYIKVTDPFSNNTNSSLKTVFSSFKNNLVNFITSTNTTGAPVFTSATKGLVPASNSTSRAYYLAGDGTWVGTFMPATTSQGRVGLVPTPPVTTTAYTLNTNYSKFWLNAAGGWRIIPTYTTAYDGLVPAPDASKSTTAFYLNGAGTWTKPTDTTYDAYSGSGQGLVNSTFATATASNDNNSNNYFLSKSGKWVKMPASAYISYNTYTGTTSPGLVPSSATTATTGQTTTKFLAEDGKWRVAPGTYEHPTQANITPGTYGTTSDTALTPDFGDTFSVPGFYVGVAGHLARAGAHTVKIPNVLAATNANGLMSSSDKTKLNNLGKLTKLTTTTTTSTNTTTISYTLTPADAAKYSWLIVWLGGTNKNYNLIMLPAYRGSGAFDGSNWSYKRGTTTYLSVSSYTISTVNSSDSMSVYGME